MYRSIATLRPHACPLRLRALLRDLRDAGFTVRLERESRTLYFELPAESYSLIRSGSLERRLSHYRDIMDWQALFSQSPQRHHPQLPPA